MSPGEKIGQTLAASPDPAEPAGSYCAGFNSNRDAANKAKGELESKYSVKVITVEGDISQPQSVELLFQAVKGIPECLAASFGAALSTLCLQVGGCQQSKHEDVPRL